MAAPRILLTIIDRIVRRRGASLVMNARERIGKEDSVLGLHGPLTGAESTTTPL